MTKVSLKLVIMTILIGYIRVTDFGIARIWRPDNAQDTSGTPGYMAPEVMCRQNHGVSVDYFAVGVMAFECMFGRVRTLLTNHNVCLETIRGKVEERDQRSHTIETNTNQEERNSERMVH